ncbi:PQQ-dependent sugar dehydrogenase [Telmatospirillum sp. J64-1]|uniref:PQQ-dependent sugar dehydrogenase n=1 Tax=Telmatospirillum sp. J64-1 TaxID=2502183 RepID=UPI00115EF319|nr:PQQ-dependent sugar dehydrogenase [Telmatospirillum sp. J64-1]
MIRNALRLAIAAPLVVVAVTPACAVDQVIDSERGPLHVSTFADGLNHPWGLTFLPDGTMLVTEREGSLRLVASDGSLSAPIEGVPEVDARGQGGLLDVALHPDFAENGWVYLSYAEAGEGGNGTAVARGRLEHEGTPRLTDVEVIFRQQPKLRGTSHFGSRLVFDNDGYLWVTLGERSDRAYRDMAQDLNTHLGKVVRLHDDGSVPQDNPFVGRDDARPEIWSYGHRNPQGMALHPETGEVWIHEHGPRGGDEINIPRPGENFGWPIATYGTEYSGATIFEGDSFPPEFTSPLYHWTPSIAPSGMAFYTGDAIPEWRGNMLVGALAHRMLVRLELDGTAVTHEEHLLEDLGERIRDVRVGPDGAVYLLTDSSSGEILRLAPTEGRSAGE